MAIYDCFQYFNEDHVLDLRLNILNEKVDYFVISESTKNHQGKEKKLNFNINNFSKFKHKIRYIVADYKENINFKNHAGGESLVEQHQRNALIDHPYHGHRIIRFLLVLQWIFVQFILIYYLYKNKFFKIFS